MMPPAHLGRPTPEDEGPGNCMMVAGFQIGAEELQIAADRNMLQRTGNRRHAAGSDVTAFPVKAILAFPWEMTLRGRPFCYVVFAPC